MATAFRVQIIELSVKVISLLGDLLAANLTALDHIKEEPSIE
jgi:hypothetical protein